MKLSEDQKSELLISTREAAIAFVEDLEHIRACLSRRKTSRGEVRRLSAILRRLLVERDLLKIAAPRFEKRMTFKAPDRKAFYRTAEKMRCLFFASCGVEIFGYRFDAISMWNAGQRPPPSNVSELLPELLTDPRVLIDLRLDNFLSQRVLCYNGTFVSRREAIKHLANIGSGVHSGAPRSCEEMLIGKIRTSCIHSARDELIQRHVMPELGVDSFKETLSPKEGQPPIDFQASDLDAVLVEILAAAELLVTSPDVLQLETIVWNEVEVNRPQSIQGCGREACQRGKD